MRPPFDVARFAGAWRWLVATDRAVLGEELSLLLGIDSSEGRAGVKSKRIAEAIYKEDQPSYFAAVERASCYGGDINLSYRVVTGSAVLRIDVTGTCVRASSRGRPLEYLGAAHVWEQADEHPLATAADHLLSAAQIVRGTGDRSLSLFIDMTLMEIGARLASREKASQKSYPRIVVVR